MNHSNRTFISARRKRVFVIILICSIALTSITIISTPKNSVHLTLSLHKEEFQALAVHYLDEVENPRTSLHGITVDGVMKGTQQDIVQFSTYGLGSSSKSEYHGFYYSPSDTPTAFRNMSYPLTQISDHKWSWADGTGNYGTTTYISPHFYYYEAYF